MTFLLTYAVIVVIAWVLALTLHPERYPNAKVENVLTWKYRRIQSCKTYSALTIIFLIALMALNIIVSHSNITQKSDGSYDVPVFISIYIYAIYIYMAYMIFFLIYRSYKNYRLRKELEIQ